MSVKNESKSPPKQRWRPTGGQIIAAIIGVAALLFIFQNTRTGEFHFLWFDFKAPVWFWMLVVFAGGVATGMLFAGRRAKHKDLSVNHSVQSRYRQPLFAVGTARAGWGMIGRQ